jgi:hypothetical protein
LLREVAAECVGEVLEAVAAHDAAGVAARRDAVRAQAVGQAAGGELDVAPGRVVEFGEAADWLAG